MAADQETYLRKVADEDAAERQAMIDERAALEAKQRKHSVNPADYVDEDGFQTPMKPRERKYINCQRNKAKIAKESGWSLNGAAGWS